MKKLFYYSEIVLTVIIGICGIIMILGGLYIGSLIPIILGTFGAIFPTLLLLNKDRKDDSVS